MTNKLHAAKHYFLHLLQAKRGGHGVHSPFVYELCEQVFYNTDQFYIFNKLNLLRKHLLIDQRQLQIEDFGAGSHTLNGKSRKVADIAQKGISSKKQSELLFRLIQHLKLKAGIELGTSLGLNTLYLAEAVGTGTVVSIEGSTALHKFAKALAEKNTNREIQFIAGKFDDVLPQLLNTLSTLDFVYVDGNHREDATLRYFEMFLPKTHNNSVLVFDDIYWSAGMTKAWQTICAHPKVKLSIDLYSTGLVFFREEIKEKQHLKLLV